MAALKAVPDELEEEEEGASDADSFGREFEDMLANSDEEVRRLQPTNVS